MQFQTKQNKTVQIQTFSTTQTSRLVEYFEKLSILSKQRFAPHGFNEHDILQIFQHPSTFIAFTVSELNLHQIIAYAIVNLKIPEDEANRFRNYGLHINQHDALFAPSVADAWQGTGVGTHLLTFSKDYLKKFGVKRLLLWGGVQSSNEQAKKYYLKQDFQYLGSFEHNGLNEDMILEF
jgi:GNAT superfamily N-acetyltransferase